MSFVGSVIRTAERAPLPDPVLRAGIDFLVGRTDRQLSALPRAHERAFAHGMARRAIAESPQAANAQHYELPPDFFRLVLGPQRKYSSCLYEGDAQTLAAAERHALDETVRHADLADGQRILELGCGWGSLTLHMAALYPRARIVAVSNSAPQRRHIEAEAHARGLGNVEVITADMNSFVPDVIFDRVVSVEMFEHMANWHSLLARVRGWLAPEGRLFIHVFSHRSQPYRFDHENETDWIARHFFTGGIMPSHGLMGHFSESFAIEREWRWSGRHYERTALDWLANYDAHAGEIARILADVYGPEAAVWRRRWRLFFLATAGLFGHAGGAEWGVSHYLLTPARAAD